jgi:hypothetical protein
MSEFRADLCGPYFGIPVASASILRRDPAERKKFPMNGETHVSRCINPHGGWIVQYFDSTRSDSEFPTFFCCARCEHDWVANRLQALILLDAVDTQV